MTTKELFEPIQQALARKFGEGQVADGDGRIVAVSELRADREAAARRRPRSAASRRRPRPGCRMSPASTRATSCCAATCPTTASAAASCAASTPGDRATSRSSSSRTGSARRRARPMARPYNYDAHIPLILMGSAIKPGRVCRARRAERSRADAGDALGVGSVRVGRARPDRGDPDCHRRAEAAGQVTGARGQCSGTVHDGNAASAVLPV